MRYGAVLGQLLPIQSNVRRTGMFGWQGLINPRHTSLPGRLVSLRRELGSQQARGVAGFLLYSCLLLSVGRWLGPVREAMPPPEGHRPLGRHQGAADGPIDAVYTWVNGSDEAWLREMLHWKRKLGLEDQVREAGGCKGPTVCSNGTRGSCGSGSGSRCICGLGWSGSMTSTAAAILGGSARAAFHSMAHG